MTDEEKTALLDQFKSGLAPDGAAAMVDRVVGLEAQVVTLQGTATADGDTIATLTRDRDAAIERAKIAEADRDAAKTDADASRRQATVLQGQLPPTPRKLAPLSDRKIVSGDNLRTAIAAAGTVEIAFSNGRTEVAGLAPVIVSGSPWKDRPNGIMLTEAVDLYGPGRGEGAYVVQGYVLILDGTPVSYTARDPITVAPGTHTRIEDDIFFA